MKLLKNKEIFEINFSILENIINGTVNGNEYSIVIHSKSENFIKFSQNGHTYNAYVAQNKDKYFIQLDGKQYTFSKVEDEEDLVADEVMSDAIEKIMPPMPGTIIKVNVSVGDSVKEGDAVVVVEAMKMETNLYTRIDGIVKEVNVKEGDRVDSENTLVIIEKEE